MGLDRMNGQNQKGFSLIEVMIAMGVVTVGLLGLLALFAQAVAVSQLTSDDLYAKQIVRESLEGLYTARNTNQLRFTEIRGASSGGIFLEGFQSIRSAGSDGLVSTADDGDVVEMRMAGQDGQLNTDDDELVSMDQYQRQILIEDINPDLRKVTVTVRYRTARGVQRDYSVSSYVSRFR